MHKDLQEQDRWLNKFYIQLPAGSFVSKTVDKSPAPTAESGGIDVMNVRGNDGAVVAHRVRFIKVIFRLRLIPADQTEAELISQLSRTKITI